MFKRITDTINRILDRPRIQETPAPAPIVTTVVQRHRFTKRFPGLAGKYLGKACGRRFATKSETEACMAAAGHAG